MTKDELLALADRCEREEASFALECQIGASIHALPVACIEGRWIINRAPKGSVYPSQWEAYVPPPYTTSLDAALTLVPEGMVAAAIHYVPQLDPAMPASGAARVYSDDWESGCRTGRTVALALCAAALRARASLTEKESP